MSATTTTRRRRTESERILAEVCRLLETIQPGDRYAELSSILVRIIRMTAGRTFTAATAGPSDAL